jgi:hypothetical protein
MEMGRLYKHIHCTDVAFMPYQEIQYQGPHRSVFIGYWWNIGYKCKFQMQTDMIIIKTEDLPKWRLYE